MFVEDYDYQPNYGMSLPYVLTKLFSWDGESEKDSPMYNIYIDNNWRLMLFHIDGKEFYLSFSFLANRRSYVIFVIDADINRDNARYVAKLWIEEVFKDNPERKDYYLQVTPIEEVLDLDSFLPNTNYLVIDYEEMKKFFALTLNDTDEDFPEENEKYTICMPIQVENVRKIEMWLFVVKNVTKKYQ